ncbi:MAG TPA: PhnD/SsuA/transferrin family substrate-binding protein [Planosporangium sp.]|jgi:ABC-type nitrate/sulfonate/bicarbonate transport system substrate-binding protein|nr:PhnD/SsuA/transferrin family substrate-binding protein [Planosporangium sp.]
MAELVVGTFTPSVLLRVARRIGALDAVALTVREQPVASSPAQFRSLLRGDLDAVLTSPDNVVAYRFVPDNPLGRTADVRILLGVDRGLGLALYARPGLTSVSSVRGGTVGVDVANSGFAFALYELLASVGLHRYRDYRLVELGSTPRRLDALLAGDCDATMLNAGNDLRADDAGCRRLIRVVDVTTPYLGTVLAVVGPAGEPARALAKALRDTAEEIVRGAADRIAVEEAAEAMSLPWPLARGYVARLADPRQGLIVGGEVDREAMANIVALRRRHGEAGGDLLGKVLDEDDGLLETLGRGHHG